MDIQLAKIIIASFLHDMGKLLWRGGMNREHKKYQVAHAEHVFDFFNKSNQTFSSFWKEIGLIASLHHYDDFKKYQNWKNETQHQLAWTVYMADNISSQERVDEENLEEKKEYENIKSFGLRPVFENIFQDYLTSKRGYYPKTLDNLDFDMTDKGSITIENTFEKSLIKYLGDNQIEDKFKNLAKEFTEELKKLALQYNQETFSEKEMKSLIYQLDMLLQNYFTFVPADSYKSIGDISLYDHTKTTVAIATALWQNEIPLQNDVYSKNTREICEEEVSLIAGDFPSIQKYIFGSIQTSKSLSKRLRAKSLTVQLLNEAVVEFLCDHLQISRASVLMNAGGKFVILGGKVAPERIESLDNSINAFFIKEYEGNLKFSLIKQDKSLASLFGTGNNEETVKDTFADLFEKLSQKKFQTYNENNLQSFFQSKSVGGKVVCKLCGLYATDKTEENLTDEEECKCEKCKKEIELGEQIVKEDGKEHVGLHLQYADGEDFSFNWSFTPLDNEKSFFLQWNSWDHSEKEKKNQIVIAKSLNFYVPKDDQSGTIKTFEDLASSQKGYLCMLKGDVDMMGLLFKHGFLYETDGGTEKGKSIYSVSRIVQLSRMLELFFGKYLHQFLRQDFPNIYTVFSGGDDFVFILPFQERFRFIHAFSQKFEDFVAKNQRIHFSVGLSLFKDKTPFKEIDEQTEELLKMAKTKSKEQLLEKTKKSDGKVDVNSLTSRGLCFYEKDFVFVDEKVKNYEEELKLTWDFKSEGNEEGISSTMLYTLYLQIKEMSAILTEEQNRAKYLHLGARIFYMLRKNLKDEAFKKIESDLKEKLLTIGNLNTKKREISELLCKITDKLFEEREKEGKNNQ